MFRLSYGFPNIEICNFTAADNTDPFIMTIKEIKRRLEISGYRPDLLRRVF